MKKDFIYFDKNNHRQGSRVDQIYFLFLFQLLKDLPASWSLKTDADVNSIRLLVLASLFGVGVFSKLPNLLAY
jgi:hypothetical protein